MAIAINQLVPLSFRGRFSRSQYIWALVSQLLLLGILMEVVFLLNHWLFADSLDALSAAILEETHGIEAVAGRTKGGQGWLMILLVTGFAVLLISYICAIARRLHDLGYSAVAALFLLIPGANILIPLILMAWPGMKGANRSGPDPLQIVTIRRSDRKPQDDVIDVEEVK